MANGYETPAEDAADTAPESPAEDRGEAQQGKISQQQANYRESDKQRCCGLCPHFDSKGHSCDVTDGEISCFGMCDSYERQDNPFREGETGEFTGGTPVVPSLAAMMPAAPPAMPPPPPPPPLPPTTMIGGKMYQ